MNNEAEALLIPVIFKRIKYNVDDADDKGKAKKSVTDGEYGNVYYKPL